MSDILGLAAIEYQRRKVKNRENKWVYAYIQGLPIAYSWQNGKGKSWLGNELKDKKPQADKGTEVSDGDEGLGDNCANSSWHPAYNQFPVQIFLECPCQ